MILRETGVHTTNNVNKSGKEEKKKIFHVSVMMLSIKRRSMKKKRKKNNICDIQQKSRQIGNKFTDPHLFDDIAEIDRKTYVFGKMLLSSFFFFRSRVCVLRKK